MTLPIGTTIIVDAKNGIACIDCGRRLMPPEGLGIRREDGMILRGGIIICECGARWKYEAVV